MKNYLVNADALRLHVGEIVRLDEQQAHRRDGLLKDLGDGRYELLFSMQFKRGEVIGYDGELPKKLATVLMETEAELGTIPVAELEAQLRDTEPEEEEEENPGDDEPVIQDTVIMADAAALPVSELAEILEINIAQTLEILKAHDVKAKNGSSLVPGPVADQVIAEYSTSLGELAESLGKTDDETAALLKEKLGIELDLEEDEALCDVLILNVHADKLRESLSEKPATEEPAKE